MTKLTLPQGVTRELTLPQGVTRETLSFDAIMLPPPASIWPKMVLHPGPDGSFRLKGRSLTALGVESLHVVGTFVDGAELGAHKVALVEGPKWPRFRPGDAIEIVVTPERRAPLGRIEAIACGLAVEDWEEAIAKRLWRTIVPLHHPSSSLGTECAWQDLVIQPPWPFRPQRLVLESEPASAALDVAIANVQIGNVSVLAGEGPVCGFFFSCSHAPRLDFVTCDPSMRLQVRLGARGREQPIVRMRVEGVALTGQP
jgi:hypothetical protein